MEEGREKGRREDGGTVYENKGERERESEEERELERLLPLLIFTVNLVQVHSRAAVTGVW